MSVVRRRRNDGEERNEKPRAVRVGRRWRNGAKWSDIRSEAKGAERVEWRNVRWGGSAKRMGDILRRLGMSNEDFLGRNVHGENRREDRTYREDMSNIRIVTKFRAGRSERRRS
jgi:hypothetical protein